MVLVPACGSGTSVWFSDALRGEEELVPAQVVQHPVSVSASAGCGSAQNHSPAGGSGLKLCLG